jgi:hypothetical protein
MFRWLAIGLICSTTVLADQYDNESSNDWKQLRNRNRRMGLSEERVDRTISACRANTLSVSQVEDLFGPVYTAQAEALPTDCVFLKIEEGLAKGVPVDGVQVAAEKRLNSLRQADELIMSVRNRRGGQHAHLVSHTCMALESGLSAEALREFFSRQREFRYGRMIHVVEAGEALKLAGLSNEHTLQIMNECSDRDLTGPEVFRVVDMISSGLRKGTDFETLHATLWESTD